MADKKIYGAVARFSSPEELLAAVRGMREKGFTRLDACSPFPVHGMDAALGQKQSPLGFVVFAGGIAGMLAALLLQWWTGAVDYPLVIGGKPLFAFEFSIPITFELTVLVAAFAAVGGMFALNGLPKFYHPLFEYEGFKEVSNHKFFLAVEAKDPKFKSDETTALLNELGSEETAIVEETE
jgi:hypothetical protein